MPPNCPPLWPWSSSNYAASSRPEAAVSPVGIGLALASLAVMPALAMAKKRTGLQLGSATLLADATETMFCAALSAILLAGLALNAAFGWWWADPVAALGIAILAVREGREAWAGELLDDDD